MKSHLSETNQGQSVVIAFSGGLDTSFLAAYAREELGFSRIITCTVNTGGLDESSRSEISQRAKALKVDEHIFIEAQEEFYNSIIRFLIYGNVTRDGYPLSVGSERFIQAKNVIEVAQKKGATAVIHGSTGAGNDQYRFDLVGHVLGGSDLKILAPVRSLGFSREFETQYLQERSVHIPPRNSLYSYNAGLWGVSIGGGPTHRSTGLLPEEAWYSHPVADAMPTEIGISFQLGEIKQVKSEAETVSTPLACLQLLTKLGNRYGFGRDYHTGTSVPGKKGRIAYEAPAAKIAYAAHQTLEKITLSQAQIHAKRFLSDEFGRLLHEAKFFDPYFEDLKAFLLSSQRRVTGDCQLLLSHKGIEWVTADSPFNLLHAGGTVYGEGSSAWTGLQAEGACLLHSYEQKLIHSVDALKSDVPNGK